MGPVRLISRGENEAPALHERAMDNLRYIRETMERASAFTGISGWGQVAIGLTAFGATAVAARQTMFKSWLAVWVVEALISLLIAGWSMDRKSRVVNMPLLSGSGRKMVFSLSPPLLAGVLLTAVLYRGGLTHDIPSSWLLLYAHGVVTG